MAHAMPQLPPWLNAAPPDFVELARQRAQREVEITRRHALVCSAYICFAVAVCVWAVFGG